MTEKWLDFYQPYFASASTAREFVDACERLNGPHTAKIMMHQAQRLLSLGEAIGSMKSGGASLKVLFFIICTENISKLHDAYDGEGKSRHYVRRFFDSFVLEDDKRLLEQNFMPLDIEDGMPSFRQIVDGLYDVRCDVVHEGRYWGFAFSDDESWTTTGDSPFFVRLSSRQLHDVIARACIVAIKLRMAARLSAG